MIIISFCIVWHVNGILKFFSGNLSFQKDALTENKYLGNSVVIFEIFNAVMKRKKS